MKQTRKGNQWYFGMKVHVGTDTRGLVHSLTITDAAQHDSTQLAQLLRGQESVLYGDKAYDNADTKLRYRGRGISAALPPAFRPNAAQHCDTARTVAPRTPVQTFPGTYAHAYKISHLIYCLENQIDLLLRRTSPRTH
jgi:IS5 family transposase